MAFTSITDANFEDLVLKSDKISLVDFWAQWCGPCRQFLPTVEEVSNEMGDKLNFFKANVDEAQTLPAKYNITGVPTIILFKNGEVLASHSGSMSKKSLVDFINENI